MHVVAYMWLCVFGCLSVCGLCDCVVCVFGCSVDDVCVFAGYVCVCVCVMLGGCVSYTCVCFV